MPQNGLSETIQQLARLSAGKGESASWAPMQTLLPELRDRVEQLREQWQKVPAPLVAVLFGGTGTGKSTLLNALAGAMVAETSERRPTTQEPTIYHPAGLAPGDFGSARYVASDHLNSLVLVDMPDADSIRTEHAVRVIELLQQADVVLFCGTQQKYTNEQNYALLRPLRDQRKIICVQTRADQDADIRKDWQRCLSEQGFDVRTFFRVGALAALRRKMGERVDGEFEFEALERYVREKLPPERADIKRKNLEGAVGTTIDFLREKIACREGELVDLDARLQAVESDIARETLAAIQAQLLDEPMAWVVATGDAVSERAFGLTGTIYRMAHGLWMLPSRLTGRLAFASLLKPSAQSDSAARSLGARAAGGSVLEGLADRFRRQHAEAGAYLARSGFSTVPFEQWKSDFIDRTSARLEENLRPVNVRLGRSARRIAAWLLPILELVWLVPFAFTIGVPIYNYYYFLVRHATIELPESGFLGQSAAMLAAILFIELVFFAWLVRCSGRQLYRRLRRDLQKDMETGGFGFEAQRAQIAAVLRECREINGMNVPRE